MAKFAKGKHALAISDRSGLAFPRREMVTEWNGAFVHYSEYERKQPQLEPSPFVSDPQGLEKARPARTEFGTTDFLPTDPFTTASGSTLVIVSEPNSARVDNDIVRFQSVKSPTVGGVAKSTLELTTTLSSTITATDTNIPLTDASAFPTSGFFMIEKVEISNDGDSYFNNEVIQYTGKSSNNLTGCIRGTNAQFRGVVPKNTTASPHVVGANIVGGYSITMIESTQQQAGQPSIVTFENSYTFNLVSLAGSAETGGGIQVLAGPLDTKQG